MPHTPSEALVADLCQRSFLSLWSEANPIVQTGKELCDLLVVCAPHVVIFSVKEIALKDSGNVQINLMRWHKRAVEESIKQIYGAERWIQTATRVIRSDHSPGVLLPELSQRIVHRVAVALGGRGAVSYLQGDFVGKGFVHVLDDTSLQVVLRELDTITDFVEYLQAKENFLFNGTLPIMQGQEKDLLALYIHQGRRFLQGPDPVIIGNDLWTSLTCKPEWKARKEADRESYIWDRLIETLRELNDPTDPSPFIALDRLEAVLRVMALENRFNRRILAKAFNEFMREAADKLTRARIIPSPSGVRYVFLASARDEDRNLRQQELELRCFVARGLNECSGDTIVGIATERYIANTGFSLDAILLQKVEWSSDDQRKMERIQTDLGYFSEPRMKRIIEEEFPKSRLLEKVGRNAPCPCGSGRKYKKCHGAGKDIL